MKVEKESVFLTPKCFCKATGESRLDAPDVTNVH